MQTLSRVLGFDNDPKSTMTSSHGSTGATFTVESCRDSVAR
jgi:hypothetical protein